MKPWHDTSQDLGVRMEIGLTTCSTRLRHRASISLRVCIWSTLLGSCHRSTTRANGKHKNRFLCYVHVTIHEMWPSCLRQWVPSIYTPFDENLPNIKYMCWCYSETTSNRSAYARLGGYNDVLQFREHGSLSEFHFYNNGLMDKQEAYMLAQINTKWSAVA